MLFRSTPSIFSWPELSLWHTLLGPKNICLKRISRISDKLSCTGKLTEKVFFVKITFAPEKDDHNLPSLSQRKILGSNAKKNVINLSTAGKKSEPDRSFLLGMRRTMSRQRREAVISSCILKESLTIGHLWVNNDSENQTELEHGFACQLSPLAVATSITFSPIQSHPVPRCK